VSTFRPIIIQGTTYEFGHLVPMTITVTVGKEAEARDYSVLVNFSCHCFTDTLDPAIHTPHYHHDGERRAFSHSRYTQSLGLPDIIRAIGNRRVYFTFQNNYVLIETVDEAGESVPYTVFFDLKRGTKGVANVVMTIASAYVKRDMTPSASPIRFHTLVAKIARGEKPTVSQPQKIRGKRK
jgi:hypothetical protein